MGFFDKLKSSLSKTKQSFTNMLDGLFEIHAEIDEELYDELEFSLVTADVSVKSASDLIKRLREEIEGRGVTDVRKVRGVLGDCIAEKLSSPKIVKKPGLNIVVIIGVNGVGKTTTIGKLAHLYKRQGNRVLVAAGDTFRAAAIDQLGIWAERADVQMIRQKEGGDPAAVIFDAIQAAKARGTDYLLCDTAGRLHNKVNLMNELEKIFRIINREAPEANLEVFLVLDATTGQNAINQAKVFGEKQGITGIVLTKLDGTAKGGVVISIEDELGVPVKYIGLGEKIEDLDEFDPKAFAKALLSE